MEESHIESILRSQQNFFKTGITRKLSFRKLQLKKLYFAIKENEKEIKKSLYQDLGKPNFESFITEIGLVLHEIRYILKNFQRWAKRQYVKTPLFAFPGSSFIHYEPYGVVLIISPWNYPLLLSISPLAGAISAGNCVVLKTSPVSPNTSSLLKKIIKDTFIDEYITLIEGHRNVNQLLLKQKFDFIFFTGSPEVGKVVMEYASKNLTPVVLELGGKSPCVVANDANLKLAAKRILWGKMINAGQTCIAPDYLLVHKDVKERFLSYLTEELKKFYGENIKDSADIANIVNFKKLERLKNLMKSGQIINEFQIDEERPFMSLVLVENVKNDEPLMEEEIFGPILPIITFEKDEEAIEFILSKEKPLAFYIFTSSKSKEKFYLERISAGGVCVNDTIMHIANYYLPFGGVGHSGMGKYHGKHSFEVFSNKKAVYRNSKFFDIPLRYPPYTRIKEKIAKIFFS